MLIMLLDNLPSQVSPYLEKSADQIQLILLHTGVYAASNLLKTFPGLQVYAIENDWKAAGLEVIKGVTLINYDTWVELCAKHQPVVTLQN